MTVQDLYKELDQDLHLKDLTSREPVDIELEEEMLIQILNDTVETSWGRNSLDRVTIDRWLSNFVGSVFDMSYERKLALILAVHMVYYSESDICYLVKVAYKKLIHEIMLMQNKSLEDVIGSIVFLPLGKVSESGPFLSYYFRKENDLSIDFFVSSIGDVWNLEGTDTIVLMDDVSISGGQVTRFLNKLKKESRLNSKNLYALFLVSTVKAKKDLEDMNVHLCAPIMMDERSQCFKKQSSIYAIFDDEVRDTIRFHSKCMSQIYGYKLILKQYLVNGELQRLLDAKKTTEQIKEKIEKDSLGFDDSELLISFEYNTPNNCLPIIWCSNDEWIPLFRRSDKLYTSQVVGGIKNDIYYI